ncbi:hypothetical protein J6590_054633 [Homalodisca vitripennis]|nr:hypothetical protein J6590_054633 [Homalodisca vitripennis]
MAVVVPDVCMDHAMIDETASDAKGCDRTREIPNSDKLGGMEELELQRSVTGIVLHLRCRDRHLF